MEVQSSRSNKKYGADALLEVVDKLKPPNGEHRDAVGVMLVAAGRRENGRWAYGALQDSDNRQDSAWSTYLSRVGVVLDYLPELAPAVIEGAQSPGRLLHAALRSAQSVGPDGAGAVGSGLESFDSTSVDNAPSFKGSGGSGESF